MFTFTSTQALLRGEKGIKVWAERLQTYNIETENRTARQLFDDITGRNLDLLEVCFASCRKSSSDEYNGEIIQ